MDKSAICVVAASGGYPDKYEKGFEISGIPQNTDKVKIIHAGTIEMRVKFLPGGRVLNIVAVSRNNDLKDCKIIAYDALDKVKFDKIYFRKDIGFKAL